MFKQRKKLCAHSKETWEEDKSKFNCTSSTKVYHCIQDEKNQSGEICIQPVWVQPHYCPEYNTGARGLDTMPCNVTTGCPDVRFWSHEAYLYPVCLNKTYHEEIQANGGVSISWLLILLPVLLVIAVTAVLSVICYVWKRKPLMHGDDIPPIPNFFRFLPNQTEEEEETLPMLNRKKSNEPFHKTAAFHEAVKYLKDGGKFLVLTGAWGSGKTKTATEVYKKVTKILPIIGNDLTRLDFETLNQPIIFDEAIPGKLSNDEKKSLNEKIRIWNEKISTVERKPFLIFTFSDVDLKANLSCVSSFDSFEDRNVINLSEKLTRGDRTQILHSHFNSLSPNKNFSEIEHFALNDSKKSLGYPEVCALFCRFNYFEKEGGFEFYKTPLRFLKKYLEEIYNSKDSDKFILLVYMSLNQMEIDLTRPNEMLFKLLESSKSYEYRKAETPPNDTNKSVKHEIDKLIPPLILGEFVDKIPETSKYRLQHEVIKRMSLIVFGTFHFDKLLGFSKREDLKGWIKKGDPVTNFRNRFGDIMPSLFINRDQWLRYEEKMRADK